MRKPSQKKPHIKKYRKKIRKIKPFLKYNKWAILREKSFIKIGVLDPKRKDYKFRKQANINYKAYKEEKETYYKRQLTPIVLEKYKEYSKHTIKIKNEFRKSVKIGLEKQGYSEQVINAILSQKDVLRTIIEYQKTSQDKRVRDKRLIIKKNKIYDKDSKRWYSKKNYDIKLNMERYWFVIKALSKSLGISIKEVRELMKLGGKEFFKVLEEKIDSPDLNYASPDELKAYRANVRDISKETGLSNTEVRHLLKVNPNHFNKLK